MLEDRAEVGEFVEQAHVLVVVVLLQAHEAQGAEEDLAVHDHALGQLGGQHLLVGGVVARDEAGAELEPRLIQEERGPIPAELHLALVPQQRGNEVQGSLGHDEPDFVLELRVAGHLRHGKTEAVRGDHAHMVLGEVHKHRRQRGLGGILAHGDGAQLDGPLEAQHGDLHHGQLAAWPRKLREALAGLDVVLGVHALGPQPQPAAGIGAL